MSLTRAEWVKMWESIKTIERRTESIRYITVSEKNHKSCSLILTEVGSVKKQIQSVIGQME